MKILKKVLFVIVALVVLVLVIALFVENDYTVKREVTVNKPKQQVFNYVRYLKNQNSFNTWVTRDPEIKHEFKGNDGTVGFVYAWEGSASGKGEQRISRINEGESIACDLHFIKPFEGKADSQMETEAVSADQTKVRWTFNGSMPYPMNAIRLFVNMDEAMGKELQAGLNTMKAQLEQQ